MSPGQVSAGAVVSFTVIVKLHCAPAEVHVTVVVPTGKKSPEATGCCWSLTQVGAAPPHGAVTVKLTLAPQFCAPAPVPTVMGSGHVIVQATKDWVKQNVAQSLPGRFGLKTRTYVSLFGTTNE